MAVSCYPGKLQNAATCAVVDQQWTNSTFQSNAPVGLSYPIHVTCPPVDVAQGEVPGTCSIGESPVYTVDATKPEDVAKGIQFAKKYNIRLVVRNTGHDLLGRYVGLFFQRCLSFYPWLDSLHAPFYVYIYHFGVLSTNGILTINLEALGTEAYKSGSVTSVKASPSRRSINPAVTVRNRLGKEVLSILVEAIPGPMSILLLQRITSWSLEVAIRYVSSIYISCFSKLTAQSVRGMHWRMDARRRAFSSKSRLRNGS